MTPLDIHTLADALAEIKQFNSVDEGLDIAEAISVLRGFADSATWRDMESAPKDGTRILAFMVDEAPHRKPFPESERTGIDIISWTGHNGGGWVSHRFGSPTAWLPLPSRPATKLRQWIDFKERLPTCLKVVLVRQERGYYELAHGVEAHQVPNATHWTHLPAFDGEET